MTILEHPGHAAVRARGDLAEYLTDLAAELAFLVRTEGRKAIGHWFADHDLVDGARVTGKTRAFIIALAAQIDIDTTTGQRLAWVTWDENGQQIPGTIPVIYQDPPGGGSASKGRRRPMTTAETRAIYQAQAAGRIDAYARLRACRVGVADAARQLRVTTRTAQRWERKLRDEGRATWRADNRQEQADAA